MYRYAVRFAEDSPDLRHDWDSSAWRQADTAELVNFRPEGSSHRPKTEVRLLYGQSGICGIFKVQDRYVLSRHFGYQSPVYKDSCVELFVKPHTGRGYFNFEFNCGGSLLCSYITDPSRVPGGFKEFIRLPEEDGRQVTVKHSMPEIVDPEIDSDVTWYLEFFIPLGLFEKYTGPIGSLQGRKWRANFYKCGDETSHPHWASWTELPEKNFHLPACFGEIVFK